MSKETPLNLGGCTCKIDSCLNYNYTLLMYRAFLTGLRTLTLLPLPGRDTDKFARALYGFPLVGAILGLFAVALLFGLRWLGVSHNERFEAVLVLATLALLTRGLHWDGLADWADSRGAGLDREKALKIMKDPAIGAFGATCLIIYALLWIELASQLVGTDRLFWFYGVLVLSRSLQVEMICAFPAARAESSMAGPFIQDANIRHRLSALFFGLAFTYPVFGPAAVAAYGLGFLVTHLFGLLETKRLGGITGDLIGASNQWNELVLLSVGLFYPNLSGGIHWF